MEVTLTNTHIEQSNLQKALEKQVEELLEAWVEKLDLMVYFFVGTWHFCINR